MRELEDFGAMVRHRRIKMGLTQGELAEKAQISRTYLSLIENDRADDLGYDIVRRLTGALALETFDKPREEFIAGCYSCQGEGGLIMIPHRRDGQLVGLIFACRKCAPALYGTELVATPAGERGEGHE